MAGRGRLSSLDLLPEEAQDDLTWALSQLNQRRRTQADILFELNDRLEAKGIETVSKSAFNRRTTRLASRSNRIEERAFIYTGIAERLTPESIAKSDLVLGEFLKVLIDELADSDDLNSKMVLELSRAYKETVVAQRQSGENQKQAEDRANAKLKKAVAEVANVVRSAGISQETMDEINRKLGIV